MMTKSGLTYERVENVIETIIKRGENPTISRVRQELGNTGSNSTISRYLNEWRSYQANYRMQDIAPAAIPDPVNKAVNLVWHELQEGSEAEIAKIKEEARLAIEAIRAQKDALELMCNKANMDLDTLHAEVNQLKTENISLSDAVHQLQNQYALKCGRLEALEKKYLEFKVDKEHQISDLNKCHEQSISQLKEQFQVLIQRHQQELDELKNLLEDKRHQWIVKEDSLKMDNHRLEKTIKNLEGIEQQSKIMILDLRQQLKDKEIDIKTHIAEQKQFIERVVEKERALSASETALSDYKWMLEELKQERDALQTLLRAENETLGMLKERLRQQEDLSKLKDEC
jgi:chromosome segregation ATPase